MTTDDSTRRTVTAVECNPNGRWAWLPDADAIASAFADTLLEGWTG
ncbi:hypothetical protein [Nonomuraea fuscirosea]